MGFVSGKGVRLQIDTSATETPAWKTAHHETVVSMSVGSETQDITTKDTSDFASAIKTSTNVTLSCTAKVSDNPGVNELTYDDILTMSLLTASDTGYIKKFKMAGVKEGEPVVEFSGFVESCEGTFDTEDVGEYTFGIRVTSKPTVSVATS